ncbi:LPS export ABC transporter permease LptG [Marinobacterium sediminicola]|uniref:Lipopolysaccharide export system permease protein n=1 Tax=Marinobacterium sediminicola TaxID=518898 RepID=A0ABY1S441_9GAMM|nr:LPS export ABC transporter permease LptG [Marinobacterium sediminicola]ULG69855.1 LPS export ABC transporter permease LptG [Marinobacterium sediminicola]SMR77865.1 lipopolysaccharide export system permease protein [Marinobacterium sediminicola]
MLRLEWYIARHVIGAILAVLLVVVGLDLVSALLDQLDALDDRYSFLDSLWYLTLTIPRRVYEFIPLSSLVGCLIGLGMLATHSELTVMRAAGFSTRRILLGVFKPVMLLALFALVLGQFIAPFTEQQAQSYRALAESGNGTMGSRYGVWHREGRSFIHINAVEGGRVIHGITRYRFGEDHQLEQASYALKGRYRDGQWQLEQVRNTRFSEQGTQIDNLAEESWQSGLTPDLLSVIVVEPLDLPISGLWSYSRYLQEQGVNADTYLLAFWSKLLQPLAILALVLIGVSFIFGPLRSVTVGQRVIAGVIFGLIFKFAQDLLGPASTVFGFPPMIAVIVPILLCTAAGLWLLRRAG